MSPDGQFETLDVVVFSHDASTSKNVTAGTSSRSNRLRSLEITIFHIRITPRRFLSIHRLDSERIAAGAIAEHGQQAMILVSMSFFCIMFCKSKIVLVLIKLLSSYVILTFNRQVLVIESVGG